MALVSLGYFLTTNLFRRYTGKGSHQMVNQLLVTFDTEDFVNVRSVEALHLILNLLHKYNLRSLFFLTGHFAERLRFFPEIRGLLQSHEIGYHSTCHSIRPNIFEYTDLNSYQDAYNISLKRETSHINPNTGNVEGKGGIEVLREIFPQKKVEAFRAPGFSWSPPHLDALVSLGIKYDFSTSLSSVPVRYKEVTFYPYPTLIDWKDTFSYYENLLRSLLNSEVTVLDFHPNKFVNKDYWDLFFPNPAPPKSTMQTKYLLLKFEALLNVIRFMRNCKLIETTPKLARSERELDVLKVNIDDVFREIALWPAAQFNCRPKYLRSQLQEFFCCEH
jgi:peptidoglycan/xylan/chitin deacetylase (PgdA/CDA1 family)